MDPLGGDGGGDGELEGRGVGRGRGRGSWAPMSPNTQQVQSLRRPHHAASGTQTAGFTEIKTFEQNKADKSPDDILKSSRLSANAAEFIPKSYSSEITRAVQQPPPRMPKHSVQERLQHARGNSNHMHAMQGQYYAHNYENLQHYQQVGQAPQSDNFSHQHQSAQQTNTQDYGYYEGGAGDYKNRHQELSGEEENYMHFQSTIQQLQNVIHSLILNPGSFSSHVRFLIQSLRPYLEVSSQLREILSIIIRESINEGNFRYSGARLCTRIDDTVSTTEKASFRETLYDLCKEETDSRALNWQQRNEHTEEEQKKCHGLILFLAELVTQMEDTPTFGLGDLLVQLITVVLKKPAPNSVKHICQALKLAGQSLESRKKGKQKEMENMMRALTELVTEGRVDTHVGNMVHSVIELRNGNWGQSSSTESTETTDTNEVIESQQSPNEPVLYGPDGKVLSAEENQFLEDVTENVTCIEDAATEEDYGDGGKWLLEEDEEFDAAYEEFLKL